VWIVSRIRFGNHKSLLYSPKTRSGIEFQPFFPETLATQGFQQEYLKFYNVSHSHPFS